MTPITAISLPGGNPLGIGRKAAGNTTRRSRGWQERIDRHRLESAVPSRRGVLRLTWDRPFDQPVPLPKGGPSRTLRDAATFIRKLPKAEQDEREWQTAVQKLIEAAEDRAPMMYAKMAIRQAINRKVERVFDPSRKEPHWRRRSLREIYESSSDLCRHEQGSWRRRPSQSVREHPAGKWFEDNDPEGVVFEYEMIE
jgi:hypothetical protein